MTELRDPLQLPLSGSRLIEASAGTGKTWTIAALYLRLVLGHGTPSADDGAGGRGTAFGRPLAPAEILVMTFTRAATRELSDRIRARLVQAARWFRGEQPADERDALLEALSAELSDPDARRAAAWRLSLAAEAMDDAAVLTIDAWCQRMLREHAFDSGSAYDETLQPDEAALRAEAVRDYWRQEVYPLEGEALEAVLRLWPDVGALDQDVARLMPHVGAQGVAEGSLAEAVAAARAAHEADVDEIKQGWPLRVARMRRWLAGHLQSGASPFHGRKLQWRWADGWLAELERWADDRVSLRWRLKEPGVSRLQPEGLRDALKPPPTLPIPDDFDHLAATAARLEAAEDRWQPLRFHAAARVAARLALLKSQAGTFGFADLLERLDAALAGEGGERLRERIVRQFPAVMVDEFQDTSPLQYRILDRLYRVASDDPGTALFLIGDPKQSIYAFRGADLRSYLRARQATAGRHAVLGTNRRSTVALVQAVNRLFEQAEARPGRGAFMFRPVGAGGGDDALDEVPFLPVSAAGRSETLRDASGPWPAIDACVDTTTDGGPAQRRRFAARCAEQLVRRLDDPAAGFEEDGRFRRLRPGDIAVLVRSGQEAEAVRAALRERGVASVYLSDRDSVFRTAEAEDLLRWLRAVAEPMDGRLARAAWASSLAGLSLAELAALRQDDLAFEARVETLRDLQATWRRQGVLPMLRRTLHRLSLPARWLPQAGGERRLTNVLHLAELLQAASAQAEGEQALLRWFTAQVAGQGVASDEQLVRLESDADLVQVVTVHKSKGLEYPVVYLPFACTFRGAEADRQRFVLQPDAASPTGRRVRLGVSARAGDETDQERLQEDLRWLYVALTRARHAVWIGVAAVCGRSGDCLVHRSAMGYLVAGSDPVEADQLPARVSDVFRGLPQVHVHEPADGGDVARTVLRRRDAAPPLVERRAYDARFDRRWSIGSFSALVRDLPTDVRSPRILPDAVREARWVEMASADLPSDAVDDEVLAAGSAGSSGSPAAAGAAPIAAAGASRSPAHRFPRGAFAGNFLHDQLEWLAEGGFALADDPDLRRGLLERCERLGWGNRAEDVLDWLSRVASTPLPPLGVPLSGLATTRAEMEFWLPGEGGSASRIDALCRQHLLPGQPRPSLPARTLRGMLMGFADLVVEHDGRFWVLDYKSNALGSGDADYTTEALSRAVLQHRYDVQAAIYLLALHRLLRGRLGDDYDPERQLGGAVFLFLRGIDGPAAGCLHLAPGAACLDALDDELAGRGEGALDDDVPAVPASSSSPSFFSSGGLA